MEFFSERELATDSIEISDEVRAEVIFRLSSPLTLFFYIFSQLLFSSCLSQLPIPLINLLDF